MLSFDFGYLVVLGAVVVILFVYRQLDKNNRSLEKIRKFAENVRHELNTFVEERTAAVKDFETVLKVHDKTAAEILRRIQGVESNLLTRTPEIEALQTRLDRYAASMAELEAQTTKVDANLDRLKEETVFVDKVTQRLKAADQQMTALEGAFVQIRQQFADINQKDLETVRLNAMAVFEKETLAYVAQLREAQKQVEGFEALAHGLEGRQDELIAATEAALRERADAVLEATEASFRETARQADDLSSVVFLKLEERIEKQAADSESRLRGEIAEREETVRGVIGDLAQRLSDADARVDEGTRTLNDLLETTRRDTAVVQTKTREDLAALSAAVQGAADDLRRRFDQEQAQLQGLTAQLKTDVSQRLGTVKVQVEEDAAALRTELESTLELDRQTAQALISEMRQTMASTRKDMQQSEQEIQTQLLALTAQLKTELDQKVSEVRGQVEAEALADRQSAQAQAEQVSQTLSSTRQVVERVEKEVQSQLLAMTNQLRAELAESVGEVQTQVAGQTAALQENLTEARNNLERSEEESRSRLETFTTELKTDLDEKIAAVRTQAEEDAESLRATMAGTRNELEQTEAAARQRLETFTSALKSDLDLKLAEVKSLVTADSDTLRAELEASIEEDRRNAQALAEELRQSLATARRELQQSEQETLEGLDARLKDYEAGFAYRYGKMEEAEKDLSSLDQNLRQAMDRVADRFQRDFAAFDEAMGQRRDQEQASLEAKLEAFRSSFTKLDKDLEELKARAYDNVSEKLQGFEEEFFADLQKRNAGMTQSMEEWQSSLQNQLDDVRLTAERERIEAERASTDALKARLQELQTSAYQQLERLERSIQESQEASGTAVATYRDELEQTRARLTDELVELERVLETRFETDRARAELAISESLTKLERDVESRVRVLNEDLARFKQDSQTAVGSVQSDFGLWQTKFAQQFKDWEAELGELQREFKASLAEKISALSEEFSLQKDELVTKSAEDRAALREDLGRLRLGIDELETTLRTRTQTAIEGFGREYEALSFDFQKKNREFTSDIDNKLRDYRTAVNNAREGAEAAQKKLFGRIEDQAALLTVNLEEIDKRQKGFIAQTKVFERADTMKEELQNAIEDLKADIARVEIQRKDLFEIESAVARIKKLGDETNEKAARFAADKKRIDLMDADFQRLLGLSQSMELRLEQVTNSQDLLQDIQLRIRKLEDYSKDIEVRYERLEKRREVLDTTTDGVDRNFALLEKTEKTVRGLEEDLKALPAEVEDLRKRLKALAQGKDDADKAVDRLSVLDKTLREVEIRIGRMEQAREWIAGVETRLTETKQAADEQVQTLATITKAAGGPTPKAGSADGDLRRSVLKLAQQGWRKEEISRATKLSLGEVELILELGSR